MDLRALCDRKRLRGEWTPVSLSLRRNAMLVAHKRRAFPEHECEGTLFGDPSNIVARRCMQCGPGIIHASVPWFLRFRLDTDLNHEVSHCNLLSRGAA